MTFLRIVPLTGEDETSERPTRAPSSPPVSGAPLDHDHGARSVAPLGVTGSAPDTGDPVRVRARRAFASELAAGARASAELARELAGDFTPPMPPEWLDGCAAAMDAVAEELERYAAGTAQDVPPTPMVPLPGGEAA